MINSGAAARLKVYQGGDDHGTATITNVTYQNIVVQDSVYAVQIESCYGSSDDADCEANPSAAELTEISFINFSGTT
jgi:galacturan 1,4-alpha-galacturonidase